jgi:ABC-type branched-subunit amino acid transport system permease subunit
VSEELLYVVAGCASLVGAFAGGAVVFISTAWMRQEARADRIDAAEDLAAANAARVVMSAARVEVAASWLSPSYGDTQAMPTVKPAEPVASAPAGAELVPVDDAPVTADDLSPIGPDRLPQVPRWALAALAVLSPALLAVLLLVAVMALVWLGWDWAAERRAARRRRREAESVVIELAHPAPADAYRARHRAVTR